MRRFLALVLLAALAACASPNPKTITAMSGQDPGQRRADFDACEEESPEHQRNTATITMYMALLSLPLMGVFGLFGPLAASKARDRYQDCLTRKGYEVTWE